MSTPLSYANETDEDLYAWLIVDSWVTDGYGQLMVGEREFSLDIEMWPLTAIENDTAEGSIEIVGDGTIVGTTVGATNAYDPGEEGCTRWGTVGPDVVYHFTLQEDEFVTIIAEGTFPVGLYVVSDPTDMATCVAAGWYHVSVGHDGVSDGPVTYYLIVDSPYEDSRGVFYLDVEFLAMGPCAGPCAFDPEDPLSFCLVSGEPLACYCDQETGLLTLFDCDASCVQAGLASGGCRMVRDVARCVCDYTCDDPFEIAVHCSWKMATTCTCSSADPCGFVNNGSCEDICAEFYPDDHFDDSADCAL